MFALSLQTLSKHDPVITKLLYDHTVHRWAHLLIQQTSITVYGL
jgi:hypothetical protein